MTNPTEYTCLLTYNDAGSARPPDNNLPNPMNAPSTPPQQPTNDFQTARQQGESDVDLRHVLKTMARFKWIILVCTLLTFSTATTIAFLIKPKYQAVVLVSPADDGKAGGGLAALAGQFGGLAEMAGVNVGGSSTSKEAALAYLKSRVFIEHFIKERNLLPILFSGKWDAGANKWKVEDPKDIPSLWDAYQYFSKKILAVTADKKTGLITITIEWKDREQAVAWANEIVRDVNGDLRQKTISETQLSLSYLEKELQKTSVVEVQQAIFKVMESQIKNKMMANVQEQFAFKVIDPAAPMDEDAYVQPKRPLIMALGLIAGMILGAVVAFIRKAALEKRSII